MKKINLKQLAHDLHADMPGRGQPSIPAILKTLGAVGRYLRRREQLPLICALHRKAGKNTKRGGAAPDLILAP